MSYQIHTYNELRQQIHDDLRMQHPEWVQSNGESPKCDSYEARLVELLENFTRTGTDGSMDSITLDKGFVRTAKNQLTELL
jgi:hypothetical protein